MPDSCEAASRAGWRRAEAAIERLAADAGEAVSPRAAGNARRLAARAAGRCPAPDAVHPGYWPTLRLTWSERAIEIEIHDDRFELYRFGVGRTDIREWPCDPDDAAPDPLSDLLDTAFARSFP